MSLGDFIKYCSECHKNILETINAENKRPCWECQKKHSQEFNKKYGINNVDEKQNR